MQVHSVLAATLVDHGLTTMFGLVGDGNVFFVDNYSYERGGHYVAAAHEAGSILMAAGYAFGSDSVGLATVTHGPGLSNTLGTLYSAVRERAPMVLIVADTTAARRGYAQKINQSAMVLPTGAGFEQVLSARTASADLARAIDRAWSERRPIVFNASVDFSFEETEYQSGSRVLPRPQAVRPDPAAMDAAVGLLATARRPIVLAGLGAVLSGAAGRLAELAAVLGAPLATTLPAKGLFEGHAYDIGVFGTFSTKRAAEAIVECDCIVAVGASLNEYTAGGPEYPFFAKKRIVQCDTSPSAFGTWYEPDATIVGDASAFAGTAIEWLHEVGHMPSLFREAYLIDHSAPDQPRRDPPAAGFVPLDEAMAALDRALPDDRSVVCDGGRFMSLPVEHLRVPSPERWSFPARGFGAIGNGVATAIGLGCAWPTAPTVAVVGDGGFMLGGITEFNTAVRHGIDLITVVCNDGSYGAEYDKLEARGFDVRMSMLSWPDLAPVAEALGGTGYTVRSYMDLDEMSDVIAGRDRPLLIDVKLDPSRILG